MPKHVPVLALVAWCALRAAQAAEPAAAPFEFDEANVAALEQRMADGSLSAHTLTARYLERIAALDAAGPALHAVIEVNPDALADADALDAERRAGHVRGALHGIPVLLKDNIEAAGRLHTSAGSLALANAIAEHDATIVARLRAAGANVLGKTNLSEWANFRSSNASSGWSGRGGQTKNPYALDRNACGSSSGTGAAIAANFATVGVGTETDGSIVCPSSVSGLVGIKPTLGLISRAGIVPLAHSQDSAGPMTRSVADAALLLGVLAGSDPRDAATAPANAHAADYLKALDANGLRGARLGIVRKMAGFHPDVEALFARNVEALKAAGAIVIDNVELADAGKYDDDEFAVLQYEFKHDINAYLSALPASANAPRSLADLIAFDERERAREMPWFGQDIFEKSQARGALTDAAYRRARSTSHTMAAHGIDGALAKQHLDALIAPTAGPAWITDWIDGDHAAGNTSQPAAVAGYPHITVPAGDVHGLPVGLSFFAGAWSEARLIKFAYAFEQATHARKAPRFLASVTE
jgi:amidase